MGSTSNVGGIVGLNSDGDVTDSENSGAIQGVIYVGGIIGKTSESASTKILIKNC